MDFYRALIIAFDALTKIVYCIVPGSQLFLKVWYNGDDRVRYLAFIEFELERVSLDGVINPSKAKIVPPVWEDYIVNETIRARIGFSLNQNRLTFNQKEAFSDKYGLVYCGDWEFLKKDIYTVELEVNDLDFIRNGTCLFRVSKKLRFIEVSWIFQHNFYAKLQRFVAYCYRTGTRHENQHIDNPRNRPAMRGVFNNGSHFDQRQHIDNPRRRLEVGRNVTPPPPRGHAERLFYNGLPENFDNHYDEEPNDRVVQRLSPSIPGTSGPAV